MKLSLMPCSRSLDLIVLFLIYIEITNKYQIVGFIFIVFLYIFLNNSMKRIRNDDDNF